MKKLILIWLLVVVGLGAGYVRGVVKIVHCDFKAPYKAEVLYGVGICTGLGAVIGWFNIADGEQTALVPVKEGT